MTSKDLRNYNNFKLQSIELGAPTSSRLIRIKPGAAGLPYKQDNAR